MLRSRLLTTLIFFASVFSLVFAKAFYIQVANKEKLLKYSKSQFFREINQYPNRGNLVDRNHNPLAINIPIYSIFVMANQKNKLLQKELRYLTQIVPSLTTKVINQRIQGRNKFTWIGRNLVLTSMQVKKIKNLETVFLEQNVKRVYPNGELASQVLGFVGIDNNGLGGVEYYLNNKLKGEAVKTKYLKDAKGRPVKFTKNNSQHKVNDLVLSIDKDIQGTVEQYLKEAVYHHSALRGGAAVMDAHTGEILAMANYPTFDSNKPNDYDPNHRRLSFVTDPFEPGSIFKTFTILSALENKVAQSSTKYFCENGKFKVQNHYITEAEAKKNFEWLTVNEILKYSSNVGTTKIAFDLKFQRLKETLISLGLNEKTKIQIPSESKGLFPDSKKNKVSPLSLSNISFGHGIAPTAIQMLQAYAIIANGGELVRPTLLKEDQRKIKRKKIFSSESISQVTKMLVEAVETGTGSNAKIPHYEIAGKTGTAQRVSSKGGYEGYIASFIGFPVNVEKRFVTLVYIEDPKKNSYYGNTVAAPVFRKITQYILYKKKEFAKYANYNEANNQKNLDMVNIKSSAPITVNPGMPSFLGLDKTSAEELSHKLGVKLKMYGYGIVKKQVPSLGAATKSEVIELYFEPPSYVE